MKKLVIILIIMVLANSITGQYPNCVDCSNGLLPLSPLSYNTIRSHVFNGTRPSSEGCTSSDGQVTIDCGVGTALVDCDSDFNGGNFSHLSDMPISTWNRTASVANQVSIVFRFDQQISLGVIQMYFWTSLSDNIKVPEVNVYWSDNSTEPSNEFAITHDTSGGGAIGQHTLTINISDHELKFRYVRITMSFCETCEWIFLSDVQFCGIAAPYRFTQPDTVMQIIPSIATVANMTCTVNDTTLCNVSFVWLYNGSNIMEVYQYRNNPQRYSVIKDDNTATLKIENVRSSDAGEYQCEARGQTNGWILRRTINLVVQTSCTHLSISANVRVVPCSTGAGETHLEDSCNFTCNTGFEMTGDNTDICQVHGDWSGIESPCKRINCNTTNGDINCTSDATATGVIDEVGCSFCCNAVQALQGLDTNNGRCILGHGWNIGNPLCITGEIIDSDPVDSPDETVPEVISNNIMSHLCVSCTPVGICENYLSVYDYPVKYYVNTTQSDSNNSVNCNPGVGGFVELLSNVNFIHGHCLKVLLPFVCRWALYPTCDPAFNVSTPQRVCRRACEILTLFVCPEAWMFYLQQFHVLDVPRGRNFRTCENLMYANGGDAPDCIDPLGGGNCFTGRGRGYNGAINITKSGKTCQRWKEQTPHQFILPSKQYPEIAGDHNYCRNPGSRAPDGPWCFTTDPNTRWEYCDVPKCDCPRSCELYHNGSDICFKYGSIGNDYVYVDHDVDTIDNLNSKLVELNNTLHSHINSISQISSTSEINSTLECVQIILGLMCHHSFPLCDYSSNTPVPREVCRSFCEEVRTGKCRELWIVASSTGIIQLPDCISLPSHEGGDYLECFIPYNKDRDRIDINTTECYTRENLGIRYNGTVNVTESGRYCQPWDSTTPHYHPLTSLYRPYLEGHNYCRNPEGRGKRPWCYTMDPAVRWEYCNTACPNQNSNSVITIVTIASPIVVLFMLITFIVIVLTILFFKKRKEKFVSLYVSNRNEITRSSPLGNEYVLDPTTTCDGLPKFPRENITHISDLGEGNYGKVIKGEAKNILLSRHSTLVATKVLKEGSNSDAKEDFIQEAKVVNQFDHPNILKLLGVCFDCEPFYIIFEYMNLGDLNSYLRSNANGVSLSSSNFNIQQLVHMAIDIAAGLEYLAQHYFVHRDLATRNCLINEQLLVKISDFGLSEDVYSRDYSRIDNKSVLPIRWMPLEAILYCKFSTQSDVWSFGIVLWEIFSCGAQPYYALSNEEVVEYVKKKKVLRCPVDCPSDLYDLMVNCWTSDPEKRPTASELHAHLQNWNSCGYNATTPLKSPKVDLEVDTASPSHLILETTV